MFVLQRKGDVRRLVVKLDPAQYQNDENNGIYLGI